MVVSATVPSVPTNPDPSIYPRPPTIYLGSPSVPSVPTASQGNPHPPTPPRRLSPTRKPHLHRVAFKPLLSAVASRPPPGPGPGRRRRPARRGVAEVGAGGRRGRPPAPAATSACNRRFFGHVSLPVMSLFQSRLSSSQNLSSILAGTVAVTARWQSRRGGSHGTISKLYRLTSPFRSTSAWPDPIDTRETPASSWARERLTR